MKKLEHDKVREILESAFLPLQCEVKYSIGNKYITFQLSDKDGKLFGPLKKQETQVMRNPSRLKFWVFHMRKQLKQEQGLKFSTSDEMINRIIEQQFLGILTVYNDEEYKNSVARSTISNTQIEWWGQPPEEVTTLIENSIAHIRANILDGEESGVITGSSGNYQWHYSPMSRFVEF